MGHREPTNLSGIQITCSTQYAPRFSGKEKPRSCSVSKSTIRPDQIYRQGISGTYVSCNVMYHLAAGNLFACSSCHSVALVMAHHAGFFGTSASLLSRALQAAASS
ncbi:hypothetical protein ACN38_g11633 [Penicillium nordicum]|uniref:Uncharacterized protein n=1 Tax=Penicillium nordicum TaxID=229535 RepID=A0A0M8NZK5_9EURO|nr:hypothetical protein ACN38_g11633 [Penicillium nordicum]